MSDPFKEFVEQMARLSVREDDTEENQERREIAASESGTSTRELDESDLIACADDEFLCSEALTLWAMIRKAGADRANLASITRSWVGISGCQIVVQFGRKSTFGRTCGAAQEDRAIHRQVNVMAIGSAVQRGSLVYVYDEKGRRLTSLLAGKGMKDGLQGYTSATVSVRRGSLIYTYDERGRRLSSTLAGR